MPDATPIRRLALLSVALLALRLWSAFVVAQPGYTDAYYYVDVASRFARGLGLSADFVWDPIELVGPLPVISHRFWMPLATVLQGGGIAALGGILGDFRAAQTAILVVAAAVPLVAYAAARSIGTSERAALVAAAIVGLGGLFAPAWVSLDGFAPAALLGTLCFLTFGRAASGDVRAGAACGLLVGLLYLTRAEGALFGVALLALLVGRSSRHAGVAAVLIAVAIGGLWSLRGFAIGTTGDILSRSTLLVRYEDFFAIAKPTLAAYLAAFPGVLGAKASALVTNTATFLFAFSLVLILPLVRGAQGLWGRLEVRAWVGLAALIFGAQSLIWTLHSTRGSYFHSLGAFVPFGVAIAVAGGERLLATRRPEIVAAWTWGALLIVAVLSAGALVQWDASFNTPARARAGALDSIPDGPFLAIDAAAWRWLSGRSVIVTPADGLPAATCVVRNYQARSIVLEEVHFSQYDFLYRGESRPDWLGAPIVRGTIKIFPVISAIDDVTCP
ncbi:MAG: hypothetical protein M3R54_06145 [Chloroflexota bacterium]|nr:hypothetical protein [Chloroflexota bacterium]